MESQRRINPMLQQMLAGMLSGAGRPAQRQMGGGPMSAAPVLPPQVGQMQQPQQPQQSQQGLGLLNQGGMGNPMQLMQMMDMLKKRQGAGIGAGQAVPNSSAMVGQSMSGGQPGQPGQMDLSSIMQKFGGSMPGLDYGGSLPQFDSSNFNFPDFNWMPLSGG